MTTVYPKLSLTALQVNQLFNDAPFGLIKFGRVVRNASDSFSLAVHTGVINIVNPPVCMCGQLKILRIRNNRAENAYQGLEWGCVGSCKIRIAITSGSFFDDVRLPWLSVWDIMLHWFFRTPVSIAAGQVGVGKGFACSFYAFCRDVCHSVVSQLDMCIGGAGLHVEIDETHIFHRKYNRGRQLAGEHVWVFGGICRESKEAFIEVVPDRSGITLWPIIIRRVYPGSIMMTDSARVYNSLHEANRGGFEHYQVNHKRHFVDPGNPNNHTNTVERQWGLLKGMVKGSMDEENLEMYLSEFIYRRKFLLANTATDKRDMGKLFMVFLGHVKETYPGPR